MRRPRLLLAVSPLLLAGCLGASPSEPGPLLPPDTEIPENALRVLFVGNSLTYVNDLPAVVAAMATATARDRPPAFFQVAGPDLSLEDHWRTGAAERAIRSRAWDYVVMQQGPSSLPQNQVHLRTWAETFAGPIREAGAVPALYMVWPSLARYDDFDGVLASYSGAAAAVNGVFLPAGQSWREAWASEPGLALYGPDGFHPSELGTWLAALVIFARLYETSPDIVPATLTPVGAPVLRIPEATAALLREAAARTLAAWP